MTTETLTWHPASEPPDDDTTVLLWVQYADGECEWAAGWRDGDDWRLCESGGVCGGTVLHWASPDGPGA